MCRLRTQRRNKIRIPFCSPIHVRENEISEFKTDKLSHSASNLSSHTRINMAGNFERTFGVNSSLYANLNSSQVHALERAIHCTTIGDYPTAYSIFDGELAHESTTVPVVMIECAELRLQQGKYGEIWEILDDFIAKIPADARCADDSSHRLIRLLHAMAAMKFKGVLGPAKEELYRTQEWLKDLPVDQYTDVHVRTFSSNQPPQCLSDFKVNIIRKYSLISYFVSICCDHDETVISLIPKATTRCTPWKGLSDLRVSLIERNMVFEAIGLFKVERLRTPPPLRLAATFHIISSLPSCQGFTELQTLWAQAELNFQCALCHSERQEFSETRQALQQVDCFLDEWCAKSDFTRTDILGLRLNVRWLRLTALAEERNDTLQVFQESTELLKDMEACNHLRTTSVYGIAMTAARRLALEEQRPQYYQHYLELHQNVEIYVEKVLGDIDALILNQMEMLTEAGRERVGLQNASEWIKAFLERHPTFSLPNTLYALHSVHQTILLALGEGITASMEAMRRLKPLLPRTLSHDLEDYSFSMDWKDAVMDPTKKYETAVRLVKKWMIEDLLAGVLSIDLALAVFGNIEQMKHEAAGRTIEGNANDLEGCSLDQIFGVLYLQLPTPEKLTQKPTPEEKIDTETGELDTKDLPQASEREPKLPPLSVEEWGMRFTALKRWLLRPSGSQTNARHCLLLMLQDIRIEILGKECSLFNARLIEYERAIEAYLDAPTIVQDYLKRYEVDWHSSIGMECVAMCFDSKGPLSDEHMRLLEISEEHTRKAIKGNSRDNNFGLLARDQRNMAAIYLHKLHIAARKHETTEYRIRLRDVGLRFLAKADEHFSLVEVESSWSSNLHAHNVRRFVTRTNVPWESTQFALHLLLEGNPEPDDVTRTKMWEWVQKSKSRSLATTMGLKRALPQSLVQMIRRSPVDSELYNKMLELEERIEKALPQHRFYLRIDLHQLLKQMRTRELLQKLLDAREGRPLTMRDVDELLNESEQDIVLVDWFHLPGLQADPKILLFTARSGVAPMVDVLEIKSSDVCAWVELFLDKQRGPKMAISEYPLYDEDFEDDPYSAFGISALVEPLTRRSKRGDTLIFSPTLNLSRIPLHVLAIAHESGGKDTRIIYRNPVVYTYSHSLLRLCSWSSESAAESNPGIDLEPVFVNGACYDKGQLQEKHLGGLEVIQSLSAALSIDPPLTGRNATKSSLLSALPKGSMFHVQMHCDWDGRPMEHCIRFPEPAGDTNFEPCDYRLTSREIFDLSVPLGSHFNLLACEGGLSAITPGDEAFGLIPALLYAGATSVVSTLWKIPDEHAAEFGKQFFAELSMECKELGVEQAGSWEENGKWVNLAGVFQRAIIKMGDNEGKPMGVWGPFILHGYWRMWIRKDLRMKLCCL